MENLIMEGVEMPMSLTIPFKMALMALWTVLGTLVFTPAGVSTQNSVHDWEIEPQKLRQWR
jgi:hypothetical protein